MEHLRIRCPCCDSIFEEYTERKIILDKTKKKSLSKPQASTLEEHEKDCEFCKVTNPKPQSPNSDYKATPKVCPYCEGRGYFMLDEKKNLKHKCLECKGTGKPIS